jgi:hypothetical protein
MRPHGLALRGFLAAMGLARRRDVADRAAERFWPAPDRPTTPIPGDPVPGEVGALVTAANSDSRQP